MTATATFGDHGTAAALANKKQMGEVLVLRDAAQSLLDKARALPGKARDGALRVLAALKLDHLARWAAGGLSGLYGALRARSSQVLRLFTTAIGVSNALGWLLAHRPTRDKALGIMVGIGTRVSAAAGKARSLAIRIPVLGRFIDQGLTFVGKPVSAARTTAVAGITKALAYLDSYQDSAAARWLRNAVKFSVLGRVVRAFCPPQYRMFAYAGGLAVTWGPDLTKAVRHAPQVIEHIPAQTGKGTEVLGEVFEVQVIKDGTTMMLKVLPASDTPDVKVVVYAGEEYDIKTLGDAETDPIRPTIDQLARNTKVLAKAVADSKIGNRADKRAAAKAHGPLSK